MKKVCVVVFIMLCFCVLQSQSVSFVNTLNSLSFGGYSVFCEEKLAFTNGQSCIKNGDIFIYNFDDKYFLKNLAKTEEFLCVQVYINNSSKVQKYLHFLGAKKVKTESVEDTKIDYYFCEKLSKKTVTKTCVFNIAIATKNNSVIMGYPAIMGSL